MSSTQLCTERHKTMHLMIDFETLDTTPTAVVLSLGCVLFDENEIIDTKYIKFSRKAQTDRSISQETLDWWNSQNEEARKVLEPSPDDIDPCTLHYELYEWLYDYNINFDTMKVWGNGASFDIPILESILGGYGPHLYKFWNIWCFRTFDKLTGCKALAKREGTHHNALDDAIYQATCLINYWKQKAG